MRQPGPPQGTIVCSDHKLTPSFSQRRLTCGASFLTSWCSKEEVPTWVNLNQYAGRGHGIAMTSPCSGVRVSRRSQSVWASDRRATGILPLNSGPFGRGCLTQQEYEHSTASELKGPRVNLTCRWMGVVSLLIVSVTYGNPTLSN